RSREMLPDGGRFFEAPRWHDGRWYVSDFHRHVVQTVDELGSAEVILEVPKQPSGLGWLPDGSLLVVSMKDHRLIRRWPDGRVTQHADVSRFCGGFLNDMVVDRSGRAYVGNFGFALDRKSRPTPTVLVRVDLDGSSSVVADDLLFPGGAVIDRIDPPAGLRFFACMLGGSDGRTLLGCAARGYYEAIESESCDAVLTMTRVDVPHAGLP